MQAKPFFLLVLSFFILWSCEKEEEFRKPSLGLIQAADISPNSANVSAKILHPGSEKTIESGFVWKTSSSNLNISDSDTHTAISSSGSLESGILSATLTGLEAGITYYVKAYVRTNTDTYYSLEGSFNTLGPLLETIAPDKGSKGTEVTLTGKFYGSRPENTRVVVGTAEAKVIEASENQIKFIVPASYAGSQFIKIQINGVSSKNSLPFEYLHNFSYSPAEVRAGKILTVTLSARDSDNIYRINGLEAKQKWEWLIPSGVQIGLEIPPDVVPGVATFEVEDVNGNPWVNISEKPLTILPGGTWTQKQDFVGKSGVAQGFAIQDAGYMVIGDELYKYTPASDSWTYLLSFPVNTNFRSNGGASFVAEEKAFFLVKNRLWCFDPATQTLNEKSGFPGRERRFSLVFSNGTNGYAGLGAETMEGGLYNKLSDFWKYNPGSDSWTQVSDFPDSDRKLLVKGVHLNNMGYIIEENGGAWSYDYTSDTFTRLKIPVHFDVDGVLFVMNNKLYYGMGNCCDTQIYEYDPAKDIQIEEVSFEGHGRMGAFSFVINNKAYIGAGMSIENQTYFNLSDVWEFIPGLQ